MGVDAMYRIGIDVGGTFTDLVAIDGQGMATLAKVPSTPADPSLGVIDGARKLAILPIEGIDADEVERIIVTTEPAGGSDQPSADEVADATV